MEVEENLIIILVGVSECDWR